MVGETRETEYEMVSHIESTARKQQVGREYAQALKPKGLPSARSTF